jgi:acyl carrier protein
MKHQEIQTATLKVLSTVLKCEVDLLSSRETLSNWDSLKHIEIIFAMEDEMNIQFPEEKMSELNSVIQIIAAVEVLYAT